MRALLPIAMLTLSLSGQTFEQMPDYSDVEAQKQEPFRIFDNLYFVGVKRVGVHLLKTSEGLILLDTGLDHLAGQVLDNIRKLGFRPTDIKYIFLSHYHFDHAGGAKRMREASGAKVGLGAEDWPLFAKGESLQVQRKGPSYVLPVFPLDIAIKDGDSITLGDTTVRFIATPGHTPGVRSFEYTVWDGGKPYKAVTFGGPGLNARDAENARKYIDGVRRLTALKDVQVNIPPHPWHNREFDKAGRLKTRKPGEPHPFVAPDEWRAWIEDLLAKGQQRLEQVKAKAKN